MKIEPGEIIKFNGSLVKCLFCQQITALEAKNDFITVDARAAGWLRLRAPGKDMALFDNWVCPRCQKAEMEFYTAPRLPIDKIAPIVGGAILTDIHLPNYGLLVGQVIWLDELSATIIRIELKDDQQFITLQLEDNS